MVERNEEHQERIPVRTGERQYVIRELDENAPLFPSRRTTFFDPEHGARTIEEVTLCRAGCGHILGYEDAELRSYCHNCGKSLCLACSSVHCTKCLKRLCTKCAVVWHQSILCPRDYFLQIGKSILVLVGNLIRWVLSLRVER